MSKLDSEFKAWAIDTGSVGLIGRYWWFDGPRLPSDLPGNEGYPPALFPTKRKALDHLHSVRRSYPRAKPVRVNVTITQ